MILDDLDSRPGSATSLLRSVVGLYLRDLGGAVAVADLVELLGALGVPAVGARGAISRVKAKGLLVPETVDGRAGYRLAPGAGSMLARGDRRIFAYRQQGDDDPWCLVSFSLPEERRAARHQLRRHLAWIGAGTVADGLWIVPGHLADEVEEVLVALGVREAATVFVTGPPRVAGPFADAAARWWDLDRVAALHRDFLARHGGAAPSGTAPDVAAPDVASPDVASPDDTSPQDVGASPRAAFARWVRAVDDWRPVPYADPGLPGSWLPADWPGAASVALFDALRGDLATAAEDHVRVVVGR
ncbi:PaaX family transcriptional regulator C-terminal domain-containing protein [Cellulosimicrobium protaetiae]|uniref:Regulator n=1 Tax=Cellulosimicrobium protaetiae TaxID=2587808 RepID=A0A6M5UDU6_9MICO|nr:PaaX family transcriptional regulator C-terminal domain-containing protein [Cellulosimicrobium protaetiae]QJW35511.1 regulator [Cellulosimicrobium protaetiae]